MAFSANINNQETRQLTSHNITNSRSDMEMVILLIGIASVVVYLLVSVWRRTSGGGAGWDGRIKRLGRRLRQDSQELRLHKFCPIGVCVCVCVCVCACHLSRSIQPTSSPVWMRSVKPYDRQDWRAATSLLVGPPLLCHAPIPSHYQP